MNDDGQIKIKLSKPVTDAKFYLNEILVSSTNEGNIYTITGSNLKVNEENTLVVTDEIHSFELTKSFVYKKLVAPNKVLVLAESGNAINSVNASNVNNATIQVEFTGGNRNELPVTLEVTIDDAGDNKTIPVKATKQLTTKDVNVEISNVNLSSLNDGNLTLTAVVKDSNGNISDSITATVAKKSKVPEVKYESVTRANAAKATITNLNSTHTDDVFYYVVKGVSESAPTVDEILRANTKTTKDIAIPSEIGSNACVVYVVAQTTTGTESEEVVPIKVAKVGAAKLDSTDLYLRKVESTDATYTFGYNSIDKEEANGFIGYRIVLKDESSNVVKDYEITKGETKTINLFDILKQQKSTNTYTLTICALADNENYINSDNSSDEITIDLSSVLTSITATLNVTDKTLSWTPNGDVANVKDYTIEIAKYDKEKIDNEYETIVASINVPSLVEYDISKIVEENGVGTYQFKVIANAKDDVLMTNTSAIASTKYNQGAGINDFSAEIKDGKVLLKGTLLDNANIYDSDASVSVSYRVYYKGKSSNSYTSAGTTINKLPDTSIAVSSLNSGTEYTFI